MPKASVTGRWVSACWAAAVGCVVLAGALRVWAGVGDFWLDEIWSLRFAQNLGSPWQAVTKRYYDNVHLLNTLYLYVLGHQANWVWYRVLSMVTGTGAVAMLGWACIRRSWLDALTTMVLAAVSFPLILYSSEARGYAPAILFAVTGYAALQQYWQVGRRWLLLVFWGAIAMGLMSHASVLYVYLSLVFWSIARAFRHAGGRRRAAVELVVCHAFPVAFLVLLYVLHIRNLVEGGGPVHSVWHVVGRALAMAAGTPEAGPWRVVGIAAACATVILGVLLLRRDELLRWVFFVSVLALAPAVVVILKQPKVLYFRYFVVCFPFFYLLLGYVLSWCYRRRGWGPVVYGIVMLLFVVGHSRWTARLVAVGRGHYLDAVLYMAEQTSGGEIVVATDHGFRNGAVLGFYADYLPPGKRIVCVDGVQRPAARPEWAITHSRAIEHEPPRQLVDRDGASYVLARRFPYAGVSGWQWFVYHRADKVGEPTDRK